MWKQTNKLPTWRGLTKNSQIKKSEATRDEIKLFQNAIGRGIDLKRILMDGQHKNFFWGKEESLGDTLIKWLPNKDTEEHYTTAFDISTWLNDLGYPTPIPIKKINLHKAGILYIYQYLEHRLLKPTEPDLISLAKSLSKLHQSLANHPSSQIWKVKTEVRLKSLKKTRQFLRQEEPAFGPQPSLLTKMANDYNLDFVREDLPTRISHGDMNFRNAFVPLESSRWPESEVMIFDFEDVPHSILPIFFELALVVERFILVHDLEDEDAISVGKAFLTEYKKFTPLPNNAEPVNWLNIIQSLNLRSLCVLSQITKQGGMVPESEWNKFFFLFELAERRANVWEALNFKAK